MAVVSLRLNQGQMLQIHASLPGAAASSQETLGERSDQPESLKSLQGAEWMECPAGGGGVR